MIGTVAASSTGTPSGTPAHTGALILGAVVGLLSVACLVTGVALPHPLLFVAGALLLAVAVAAVLLARTGRRAASAIIAVILAAAILATPALVRTGLTGSSVVWTAQVAEDEFSIIDGKIYTFSIDSSSSRSERIVRLLDPDDGTVTREWSAEALERPSITAEGGVVFATTAVSTTENSKVITMFDAEGHKVWQVPFDTGFDSDIHVTAASGGAVHVVACETADSGSDRQGCRLTTIDTSGRIVDERSIWFEWPLGNGESWSDLPGKLLPPATLVTNLEDGVDMYSPRRVGPIATLPLSTTTEDFGSRFTQNALITAERHEAGKCRLVARSFEDGAQAWETNVPCTPMTSMRLWSTADDSAPLYLGLEEIDTRTTALMVLDPASGGLTTIPEAGYTHSTVPAAAEDLVRDVTAGRFVVATAGGRVTVSEAVTVSETVEGGAPTGDGVAVEGGAAREFEVPGTADTPAFAGGAVLAIVSDTSPTSGTDAGEVSPAIRHNPYLVSRWFDRLGDESGRRSADRNPHFPQCLTVVDVASGRELSSTVFTSPITSVTVLPDGQTVAAAEDGTLRVVAAST